MNLQELWKIHRQAIQVIESTKYSDEEKKCILTELYSRLAEQYGNLPTKPKKLGRKGTKIHDAYNAITTEPQSLDDILKQFDVSLGTMRQHKRFDPFPDRGKIHTRTVAGTRMVWRESN